MLVQVGVAGEGVPEPVPVLQLFEQVGFEKLEIFEREVEAHRDRDRLLEERFEEALRKAEEDPDDGPPPRPFDLD